MDDRNDYNSIPIQTENNMSQFNFTPQGWECPKCHRVYSPTTIMCIACPQHTTGTTGASTTPYPVGVGGYGTTTSTSICRLFVADPESGTSPRCINCGKSQLDHMTITNTFEKVF